MGGCGCGSWREEEWGRARLSGFFWQTRNHKQNWIHKPNSFSRPSQEVNKKCQVVDSLTSRWYFEEGRHGHHSSSFLPLPLWVISLCGWCCLPPLPFGVLLPPPPPFGWCCHLLYLLWWCILHTYIHMDTSIKSIHHGQKQKEETECSTTQQRRRRQRHAQAGEGRQHHPHRERRKGAPHKAGGRAAPKGGKQHHSERRREESSTNAKEEEERKQHQPKRRSHHPKPSLGGAASPAPYGAVLLLLPSFIGVALFPSLLLGCVAVLAWAVLPSLSSSWVALLPSFSVYLRVHSKRTREGCGMVERCGARRCGAGGWRGR